MIKQCVICGVSFDALRSAKTCSRPCMNERRRVWERSYRDENREEVRANERRRYHADIEKTHQRNRAKYRFNIDRSRQRAREWRWANPERTKAAEKKWGSLNRDTLRAKWKRKYWKDPKKGRSNGLAYYRRNIARRLQLNREWVKRNPERQRVHRRNIALKRRSVLGKHTPEDIAAILGAQRNRCGYCRTRLRSSNTHIDHIIALARGGTNDRRNLQALCSTCNRRKHSKDPIDFAQSVGLLL